jgi:hypothetical protein
MVLQDILGLRNTLVTLLWSLVAWLRPSALLSWLSGWQTTFKLFRLVWWMRVHSLLWLLFGFNIQKWNPGFISSSSYDVTSKFVAIFVDSSKKSKNKSFSVFCGHRWVRSESSLRKTRESLACYNLINNSSWNLRKFKRKFWNCEASSFTTLSTRSLTTGGRPLRSSS